MLDNSNLGLRFKEYFRSKNMSPNMFQTTHKSTSAYDIPSNTSRKTREELNKHVPKEQHNRATTGNCCNPVPRFGPTSCAPWQPRC